jgi:starch synthase
MAKPLSILYVSSEVFPFAKVGGVGDIAYSLPLALRELGHDVRVMLPKYGIVSERRNKIHEINRLRDMPIQLGDKTEYATVKSSSINNPRNKVQAYITTNLKYFDSKKGVYNDTKTGSQFEDNDERFIFFCRSVVETCLLLGWFPDVIHSNDWQTGLISAYLKTMFPSKFKKTKTLFTIHNFAAQGTFHADTFMKTGLNPSVKDNFIHKNKFNFMKPALIYSDYINTVSPTYADEILKEKKYSDGLNAVLSEHSGKFTGIINGIDVWGWNPKTDPMIKRMLTDDFEEYKEINKKELLNQIQCGYSPKVPVIGLITRFSQEKGLKLLIDSIDDLMQKDIIIVILGEGDIDLKKELANISEKYPDKFVVKAGFDEEFAHQLEAGCDMYLMPSQNEACGLNSMYSLIYGTVPIVRATGGLKDIVKEYNEKTKEGNGFFITKYNSKDLVNTVEKAVDLFRNNKDDWNRLAIKGMGSDFTWTESAKQYDKIYYSLFKE